VVRLQWVIVLLLTTAMICTEFLVVCDCNRSYHAVVGRTVMGCCMQMM